jgi:phytoene dehydrogenase-like protein
VAGIDAVVVGSGPNGLAAAITLARAGLRVSVFEGAATVGGGTRTEALTLDGYIHDVCSAVHPVLLASPFFQTLDLAALGVRVLQPDIPFAHPLDSGRAGSLRRSVGETAALLGTDGPRYEETVGSLVERLDRIVPYVFGPLRSVPPHPAAVARFGLLGVPSVRHLSRRFRSEEAKVLLAGAAAHSMERLTAPLTGAFGLLFLMLAHGVGWPVVEGGSARIGDALVSELTRLGGTVEVEHPVRSLAELPTARAVLLDTSPRQFLALAGKQLTRRQGRPWSRFALGPGVCKVDWALDGPVPWEADVCRRTATVHVCGTMNEVARSEADVSAGRHSERPFVLVAQPSVLDSTRAPVGHQTLWAYCQVPNGSPVDMTYRIEDQIERFAPGFRDRVLARVTRTAAQLEGDNPNQQGGDISGGASSLRQTIFRPVPRWNTYRTPVEGTYLCSASTPPGGGVHGMCGYFAARTALRDRFGIR